MLFKFIILSCDYDRMSNFQMYKKSEKKNQVFMHTHTCTQKCGSNRIYNAIIVFVRKKIVCAFLLQGTHNVITYRNNGNKTEVF